MELWIRSFYVTLKENEEKNKEIFKMFYDLCVIRNFETY